MCGNLATLHLTALTEFFPRGVRNPARPFKEKEKKMERERAGVSAADTFFYKKNNNINPNEKKTNPVTLPWNPPHYSPN